MAMDVDNPVVIETDSYKVTEVWINENMPAKIFSFSLFLAPGASFEKAAWRSKYFYGQLDALSNLLDSDIWEDYGVYHLIEESLYNKIWTLMSNGNIRPSDAVNTKYTKLLIKLMSSDRYQSAIYSLKDPDLTPFYGTVIRYIPLIIPRYEVVHFRDAHSTMPNHDDVKTSVHTSYGSHVANRSYSMLDRTWTDRFEVSGMYFMFYHFKGYQPVHAGGSPRLLAGAWGARNAGPDGISAILSKKDFLHILGNGTLAKSDKYANKNNKAIRMPNGYGVDEQILQAFYDESDLRPYSAHIGIVWLLYLFFPMLNISSSNVAPAYTPTHITGPGGNVELQFCYSNGGNMMITDNYYTQQRCVLVSLIKASGMDITMITLRELIDIMGNARGATMGGTFLSPQTKYTKVVYDQMISSIPDAGHLWDTLFANNNIDRSLTEYLAGFVNKTPGEMALLLTTICDESFDVS